MTRREQELLRLLKRLATSLREADAVDPTTLRPFDAHDAAVQQWLQLAIQCCIDLRRGLLGRFGVPWTPLGDIFPALVRRGIIDRSLAQAMGQLLDLRKVLAHGYADLTPAETWRTAREALPALARFAERMSQQ
jgi:uncharacterized protein YutE (UPF0331/DUF86 family)